MRSRNFVVLATIVMIIAFTPAFVSAEEINHPQVVKMTEAELDNYNPGGGETDNVVAFYNNSPANINTYTANTIYPLQLEVYSDLTRATVDWGFYVNGTLADQCATNPMSMICCITDSNGSWVTYNFYFEYFGNGLAKATAFELPLAYILSNGCNKLNLEVYLSNTINGDCYGQFFMVPNTIRMRPRTQNVWPDTLWGSTVIVEIPVIDAYLNVTSESNPPSTNVIAGANMVPMLNLKFQAVNDNFAADQLQICETVPVAERSIESVSIHYQSESGMYFTVTQPLTGNYVNFNLGLGAPLYVPANSYRIAEVYFNLRSISPTGAYTGDVVAALFDCNDYFHAVSSQGLDLSSTSNGVNVSGNEMVVHGNVPTIIPDVVTNTTLANGPVELYCWQTVASEGTGLNLGQITSKIILNDAVVTANQLCLSQFQILEGSSYATAMALVGGITTGVDAYNVWDADWIGLCFAGHYLYPNGGLAQSVTVTFYDDRLIPPGTTKYYILKAMAQNVNTGAGSNDCISVYMYDGDTNYLPPQAADFHPETINGGAILDDSPSLVGDESYAHFIWSDNTGTDGNLVHQQASWVEPSNSSKDWFNGYLLHNLNVVRTLTSTYIDDQVWQNQVMMPTEFKVTNYPNPFNAITQISFALPEAANVILTVYDITGREVVRLADGYYSAGEHSVNFDASSLSSGIYFYSITAGEYTAVKKMMLVK